MVHVEEIGLGLSVEDKEECRNVTVGLPLSLSPVGMGMA